MSVQQILSIYGAGLSTLLASVQLYGFYKNRTRLFASYDWYGTSDRPDELKISNVGKIDIMVEHYQLFFSRHSFFGTKQFIQSRFPEDSNSFQLKANSTEIIVLEEPNKINFKKQGKRHLFVELSIVGRKKKILKIK